MKAQFISRLAFIVLMGSALSPLGRAQSQLVGEWQGTAKAGDTQLRIAWHVAAAPDGTVTATIDNLDQKIYGLPVSSMTVKDGTLTLTLDTVRVLDGDTIHIRGVFTGVINADATEIHGSWFQGQALELDMKRVPATPPIAGDWQGTLSAGGVQLRLALHIAAGKDGALTATLDSLDQGALGIPVSSIDLKQTQLTLGVPAVGGTYTGTVNQDASEIDGTWSQGQPLALNFKRAAPQAAVMPAPPSEIDGAWLGTLHAGAIQLRLVFKIANTSAGLTAQMQSPDQSPVWVPCTSVKRDGAALTIEINSIGAKFAGKISAGLDSIDGTFTQMGNAIPLVLKKGQS